MDDYSRAVWISLLAAKHEVKSAFHFFQWSKGNFIQLLFKLFFEVIMGLSFPLWDLCFRNLEFNSKRVGIPQQNGRAEGKHRHILEVARAFLFQAHLPIQFWGESILTDGYLININRRPSTLLNGKSPYELLFGKAPPLMRIFGFWGAYVMLTLSMTTLLRVKSLSSSFYPILDWVFVFKLEEWCQPSCLTCLYWKCGKGLK